MSVAGVEGREAHGFSTGASITANGHRVAFESSAADLVEGDTNGDVDVFVRSRPGASGFAAGAR